MKSVAEMIEKIKAEEAKAFDAAMTADSEAMENLTAHLRGLYATRQDFEKKLFSL